LDFNTHINQQLADIINTVRIPAFGTNIREVAVSLMGYGFSILDGCGESSWFTAPLLLLGMR
jgi:hypothetical protein